MENKDYRIEPKRLTPRQQAQSIRQMLGSHVISIAGLWPTPKDYSALRTSWSKDLISGLTVGVVALPLALGFGVASGAGAAAGLVTAVVAGLVAAIFGGSHLQVSGPTGAMTVVLLPVIAKYGVEMVPLVSILAGLLVVVMAFTAVGRSIELIPYSVVEGFTMGIGIIIALQQFPLLFDAPRGTSESTLGASWQTLKATDWSHAWKPLAIVALVVVLHLIAQIWFPKLPISLIAIIIATLVVEFAGLEISRIGELPSSLPAPHLPAVNIGLLQDLAAPALVVAALAALESLLSARVADGMRPDVPPTNPDRELLGQGLANVASGLFGGLPATGAIARTAVNVRGGAKTRMSAIIHAIFLLIVMAFLGPLVALIPMAALGGVLLVTAGRMVSPRLARQISRTTRADKATFWLTLIATVLLDLVTAVLLGLGMAAIMSLRHMASYSVVAKQKLPAQTPGGYVDLAPGQKWLRDQLAIFRIDGALFYGNAQRFVDEVCDLDPKIRAVIVRCHRLQVYDASGADGMRTIADRLRRRKIVLVVQGMTDTQLRTSLLMESFKAEQHEVELVDALALAAEKVLEVQEEIAREEAAPKKRFGKKSDLGKSDLEEADQVAEDQITEAKDESSQVASGMSSD